VALAVALVLLRAEGCGACELTTLDEIDRWNIAGVVPVVLVCVDGAAVLVGVLAGGFVEES
jgi:hypothetical protein